MATGLTLTLGDKLRKSVSDDLRRLTFLAFGELIANTPRRTGRAQNSWNVSVGRPDYTVPPEGAYGRPPVMRASISPSTDLTRTHAFITSNLFYMEVLNQCRRYDSAAGRWLGSERQPQAGWVERAGERALDKVQRLVDSRG